MSVTAQETSPKKFEFNRDLNGNAKVGFGHGIPGNPFNLVELTTCIRTTPDGQEVNPILKHIANDPGQINWFFEVAITQSGELVMSRFLNRNLTAGLEKPFDHAINKAIFDSLLNSAGYSYLCSATATREPGLLMRAKALFQGSELTTFNSTDLKTRLFEDFDSNKKIEVPVQFQSKMLFGCLLGANPEDVKPFQIYVAPVSGQLKFSGGPCETCQKNIGNGGLCKFGMK